MKRKTTSNSEITPAKSRRSFLKGLGATSVATPVALAGLNKAATAQNNDPVIIGCPVSLTGMIAADGIEVRNGLEMAAEELNEQGGILGRPIEVHFADTESKGDDMVIQATQRLIDRENASAIITSYNLETGAAMINAAADAGIIAMHAFTSTTHDDRVLADPDRYWGIFQYCPPERIYGEGLLDMIQTLEETGKFDRANDKIAIINGPGSFTGQIAAAVRDGAAEHGYTISLFETATPPVSDWGPVLAKLRADPPAVIAMTHYHVQDQAQFMNQFTTNPTDSLIYMLYGPSLGAFRDIAGENSVGCLYSSVIGVLQDEIGTSFAARYRERYGENSSPSVGAMAYQAMFAYATAAALAGGPGEPYDDTQNRLVAEKLKAINIRGPVGTMRFHHDTQSAVSYPGETDDPSLGMPHIFSQIQDAKEDGYVVSPWPYAVRDYETPSWIKGGE
ncbi:ABC transporter substrate-binding protein [Celeribacter naphthalenivorans]|uniref:ABC transporter substrate-binding protein n=1 Tax=Celeribacter naphthalenivorans TaxID=1614694 RepID=UPI001CFC4647|nr:ABC transporter substrate-binding protein [Celeribacter naphthalenivorans]